MEETAAICTQATAKSLVILDEVGRGTSTFDGLAIAQAVVEYIHTSVKARCLFATHYHELTALPEQFQGISSYYASCRKTQMGIRFLYKIVPGVADGSFGVEVAKLAQLPDPVIVRAQHLLQQLERQSENITYNPARATDVNPLKENNSFPFGSMEREARMETSPLGPAALYRGERNSELMEADRYELKNQIAVLELKLQQKEKKLAALEVIDYDNLSPKAAFDILWKMREQ